ncbi:hypothetical protein [Arthrobacter sp. SX1312]|uniref:hypothetical protein n=1 Tax=Arthrobacter sp. SX1312 TaxID=2058896 RepID=UPI000CE2C45B|nr:hypothetical protein [Arthrobacter sp. SX1312]
MAQFAILIDADESLHAMHAAAVDLEENDRHARDSRNPAARTSTGGVEVCPVRSGASRQQGSLPEPPCGRHDRRTKPECITMYGYA